MNSVTLCDVSSDAVASWSQQKAARSRAAFAAVTTPMGNRTNLWLALAESPKDYEWLYTTNEVLIYITMS
jgi:hypothetical protein